MHYLKSYGINKKKDVLARGLRRRERSAAGGAPA